MPNYNILVPREKADKLGWAPRDEVRGDQGGAEGAGDPQMGTPYAINVNAGWRMPTGLLCKQPPYGGIRAIELATGRMLRSEEHTSELQSLMRISYAVFCLKKKKKNQYQH